jgi:hypothetical protein
MGGNNRSGKIAGRVFTNGYRYVHINGRWYLVHRLIFLHKNGRWPTNLLDHKSGNLLDNLDTREATETQNRYNQRRGKRNTSGFKGASLDRRTGRWRAQIMAHRKWHHLGVYDTVEAAHDAYCEAAKRLHGEFARFD